MRVRKSGEVFQKCARERKHHTYGRRKPGVTYTSADPLLHHPNVLIASVGTVPDFQSVPTASSMPSSMQQDLFRVVRRVSQAPPTLFASPTLPCLYDTFFHIVLYHDITCGHPLPSLRCIPFHSDFSAPLRGTVKQYVGVRESARACTAFRFAHFAVTHMSLAQSCIKEHNGPLISDDRSS